MNERVATALPPLNLHFDDATARIEEDLVFVMDHSVTVYVTSFCRARSQEDYLDGLLRQWRGYGGAAGYAIEFSRSKLQERIFQMGPEGFAYGLHDVFYKSDNPALQSRRMRRSCLGIGRNHRIQPSRDKGQGDTRLTVRFRDRGDCPYHERVVTTARWLSLALTLLLASEPLAASWDRVRAIPPGTRVLIQVPDRLAPRGQRVTPGAMESVSEDSVVVRTKNSALRSIPRNRILRVKVSVPIGKRGKAWAISGSLAAFMFLVFPYLAPPGVHPSDHKYLGIVYAIAAGVSIPVSVVVHRRDRWRTVYPVSANPHAI